MSLTRRLPDQYDPKPRTIIREEVFTQPYRALDADEIIHAVLCGKVRGSSNWYTYHFWYQSEQYLEINNQVYINSEYQFVFACIQRAPTSATCNVQRCRCTCTVSPRIDTFIHCR